MSLVPATYVPSCVVETLCSREIQLRFDVAKNYNVIRIYTRLDFFAVKENSANVMPMI